ncbi:hypothetical protein [Cellulomonas telluris]|uniref:hypothetical protein n=1 Tax=Cellulomonas telluris TaxID=2306636 RepID=UPI0010A82829|nr:hypothetical protein [Cellulomonas telluris]
MTVSWSATSTSGRFVPTEVHSDVHALAQHVERLRSAGSGYLEVRRSDDDYPVVALGFRSGWAVVHVLPDADTTLLMAGNGSLAPGDVADIPVMDDVVAFDGAYVMSVHAAWSALLRFVRTARTTVLGDLVEL